MDKSTKKKKKKSTNRLLEQMEFYFSDSNLRRDKFLREKLILNSTRKAINLSLFLNFNNIKAITSSVSDIKDALSSSTLLTVSVDNEELFVARKDWEDREDLHSFLADLDGNNQGFDKRTIYIENLPSNANQNWLRQLFSRFGKVNLVSVPKFKFKGGGQRIKQFCFIEFANEENLQSAMEYFKQFNGILCYDEADNLLSIHKFHEEEEELQQQQQKQPKQTPEVNELDVTSEEKKTNQDQSQQAVKKSKRRNRKKKAPQVAHTEGETKVEENVQEQEQDTVEEEEEEEEDEDNSEKKSYPELNDNMIYDLKIMPKMEWKRLRNKYLNLQREMVREMKKQAYYRRMQMGHNNIPEVAAPAHQAKTGPTGIAPVSKKRHFEANDEEVAAAATVEEEGENGATKPKRRKRGREKKIKEAIKKSSHIFFDPPAD